MDLEAKKAAVKAALEFAFNKGAPAAEKRAVMSRYINPRKYIQHSAAVPDGFDGLMGLVAALDDQFDDYSVTVHRVIGEGDIVFAYCHYRFGSTDTLGKAIAEIFRFEGGLIVEHWDVIQDLTDQRANSNSMF